MKKANLTKKPDKKTGKKYPLRGKPVIYRDPFKGVAMKDWEALK